MIAALRSDPPRDVIDTKPVVEYIAHLELRTFPLRQSIMHIGNTGVSLLLDFIDDEAKFTNWMRRKLKENPALLGDPLPPKQRSLG